MLLSQLRKLHAPDRKAGYRSFKHHPTTNGARVNYKLNVFNLQKWIRGLQRWRSLPEALHYLAN
ncbi:hypothetical protein [Nostoc sp. UHCC 0302]|uniref:hypothetical protein n=1 Tax=Nostoc sp. UHCC 0302 TaxID=3134896 RepID=UPI00311CB6D4